MADSPQPLSPTKSQVFIRRTSSTLFLWAIVSGVFISRWSWAFLGLITILVIIAMLEYFRMLRAAKVACFPRFAMLATLVYSLVISWRLAHGQPLPPELDAIAICAVTIGAFTLQLRRETKGIETLLSVASTVLGFIYIPVLFHFATRVLFITPDGFDEIGKVGTQGAFLLLWMIAVTKFTDMGAYITGSVIGKHKMIPHVSPGKTWEGFGGALFFSQLVGIGLFFAFPSQLAILGNLYHVVIIGVILALLAVIGDLAESIVKRSLQAKDSGQILPGIGGSLDLIDSICFSAPALYFYLHGFLLCGS